MIAHQSQLLTSVLIWFIQIIFIFKPSQYFGSNKTLRTSHNVPNPYAVPYCTHFNVVSGNSVAEWEKDIRSKCKNLVEILWQSEGNLLLVPYCTNLFEKRLSLSLSLPPLNSKQEQEPIHFAADVSLV